MGEMIASRNGRTWYQSRCSINLTYLSVVPKGRYIREAMYVTRYQVVCIGPREFEFP